FSTKICNSDVLRNPPNCPVVPADTEEIRAQDIQRSKAQEPRRTPWGLPHPPREEQWRVPGEPPIPPSDSAEAPGNRSDEPTAPPAAVHAVSRFQQPWTQRPKTPGHTTPKAEAPTEPRGPGPGRQPPGVSQHTPKHPAPDTENHKYTSGQRLQQPAGRVAGRKQLMAFKQCSDNNVDADLSKPVDHRNEEQTQRAEVFLLAKSSSNWIQESHMITDHMQKLTLQTHTVFEKSPQQRHDLYNPSEVVFLA
ncbi:hypothetical protein CRENBAI_004960, partial [Crenichthys baileyi]